MAKKGKKVTVKDLPLDKKITEKDLKSVSGGSDPKIAEDHLRMNVYRRS